MLCILSVNLGTFIIKLANLKGCWETELWNVPGLFYGFGCNIDILRFSLCLYMDANFRMLRRRGVASRFRLRRQRRLLASKILDGANGPLSSCKCNFAYNRDKVGVNISTRSRFNLQLFLDICVKHWTRWLFEVDRQRETALKAVGRDPTVRAIDALMGLERLYPQMLKVSCWF